MREPENAHQGLAARGRLPPCRDRRRGCPKAGRAARGDQRDGPLRLLSYGDVFQENYTDVVLKPFTASRGIPVEFVPGDTSVSMLDRLRAEKDHPQIDVVIMDSSAAATACAEGLVEPVNPRILPVLKDLYDSAQAAGGACGPGVTFDHLVIVYDSARSRLPRFRCGRSGTRPGGGGSPYRRPPTFKAWP